MAINIVNNTADEKDFNFLTNQSSILLASDTNNVTVNGVNVIVDKPKVGDVMCVKGGQVVWIDGLSITPEQLSQEIEPVGICVSISGNKAMVRYRTEYTEMWAAGDRFEIPYFSYMNDGRSNRLEITFKLNNAVTSYNYFDNYHTTNRYDFSYSFNEWFKNSNNHIYSNWSSELVELDSDKQIYPSAGTTAADLDKKVGTYSFKNRVIVTAKYTDATSNKNDISINSAQGKTDGKFVTANYIGTNDNYYKNNGFISQYFGGCCRAKFYDHYSINGLEPTKEMKNINKTIDSNDDYPVKLTSFRDINTSYCKILRDNFSNYDEYIDSMMIKLPCGKGGAITELPSGKENTYKLADCTFLDNTQPVDAVKRTLYPAAYRVSTIGVHAPCLEAGNWWLPSLAEMVQMMHDVTYDSTKSSNAKLDIVNTVLNKLHSFYGKDINGNYIWTMLDAVKARWTCSKFDETNPYARSYGASGVISNSHMSQPLTVSPITIYEF